MIRKWIWLDFWIGKIMTIEEALDVIKKAAYGFYCIAALEAVLGVALIYPNDPETGIGMLVDAAIFAGLAVLLQTRKSRIASALLFAISSLTAVMTAAARLNGASGGGSIVLAFLILFISIRALMATFKYHSIRQD